MHALVSLMDYYAFDLLRADGYPVRFSRLGMVGVPYGYIWLLCWVMEVAFAVAYFRRGTLRTSACLTFWLSYLAIVASV